MLIPDTDGDGGEAVKVAVQRLTPQLKALQAGKLLRLTVNEGSSRLKVRAIWQLSHRKREPWHSEPVRAGGDYRLEPLSGESEKSASAHIPSVQEGSRMGYRLYNDSDRPVYFAVFCSDSAGRLSVSALRAKTLWRGCRADRSWGEFDGASGWGDPLRGLR